jgi:hypothetical protein
MAGAFQSDRMREEKAGVTHCKGEKTHLRVIQDPISKLSPEMLYRQVQFLVEESDWTTHAQDISNGANG